MGIPNAEMSDFMLNPNENCCYEDLAGIEEMQKVAENMRKKLKAKDKV